MLQWGDHWGRRTHPTDQNMQRQTPALGRQALGQSSECSLFNRLLDTTLCQQFASHIDNSGERAQTSQTGTNSCNAHTIVNRKNWTNIRFECSEAWLGLFTPLLIPNIYKISMICAEMCINSVQCLTSTSALHHRSLKFKLSYSVLVFQLIWGQASILKHSMIHLIHWVLHCNTIALFFGSLNSMPISDIFHSLKFN